MPSSAASHPISWRARTQCETAVCDYPERRHRGERGRSSSGRDTPPSHLGRLIWATLLKRVFDIDLEHCPNSGGNLTIIAAILDPTVIAKILTHLSLPIRAPPRTAARTRAALRAPPNRLIANQYPIPRGSAP